MTPKELELLQGMVSCYHVCHANFEDTVGMVGSARGLSPEEVIDIVRRLKRDNGEEYKALRQKLPSDFPM